MRDVLFKAKTVHGNLWIESHSIIQYDGKFFFAQLLIKNDQKTIIEHEIIKETLCQFIGLTDKNDKKIFEGDLFLSNEVSEVLWNERLASFVVLECGERIQLNEYDLNEVVITGNIHD